MKNKRFTYIPSDILQKDALVESFRKYQIDVVVHLAAYIPKREDEDEMCSKVNIEGTRNILECMKVRRIRKLIYSSTQMVYGFGREAVIDENSPTVPETSYGLSKLRGEELCRRFSQQEKINTIVLRFSGVYGMRKEESVVRTFIENAQSGKEMIISEANKMKNIVYIKDVVNALLRAIQKLDQASFEIVNIGGHDITLIDLANLIKRITRSGSHITIADAGAKPGLVFKSQKAYKLLGYKAGDLEASLRDYIALMKSSVSASGRAISAQAARHRESTGRKNLPIRRSRV